MSEKKPNNIPNTKEIDDDQSHSDSDETLEEKPTAVIVKSEKKKPIIPNFGRPRKHPYKPGKYKCVYCETMCSKPSVLTKHLRAHTNERPFPCSLCKRSFKTKSNLSKHEKSKSHSSKLEESVVIKCKQSKREKVEMMLEALSGIELFSSNIEFDSINDKISNIEYDGTEKKIPNIESTCSSPSSNDDKFNSSEENSISENVKKEKNVEHIPDISEDLAEKVENSSSCSGVLTINSQGGPITVEVQINLETMRHLQQGLSNMTSKKSSQLSPITQSMSRNDAELRAAESILHMANQRPHISETFLSKDDYIKNGTSVRKLPGTLSPLNRKSPEMINFSKSNVTKPSSSKDSNSNKSTPLEEFDPINFKSHTKCLVKENLLKKMKRKQVQEINNLSIGDSLLVNSPGGISHNNMCSNNKSISEKATETILSYSITRPSHVSLNPSHLKNETVLKHLISDSKSAKANKGIYQKSQSLNTNSQSLNFRSTPNSPTIVVFTISNSSTKNLVLDSKTISNIDMVSISESNKANLDINTAILSKVITNTQSLHQHQGNKLSNVDNLSITNTITTSRVAISSSCNDSNENYSIESVQQLVKDEHMTDVCKSDKQALIKQISIQTTQESENDSSPRLCIVEESANSKSAESDEEIDVVNTDSDDDRLPLQRIPEANYSETSAKRRKISCDDGKEMIQTDTKRIKEIEKCVHMHAPNINAKDLMQDCPLNLSANRQPTIPPVSQIPVSVLQNLYQSISPSSVSMSSSTNSSNVQGTSSPISVLTNHNPAHSQSFQNFSSSTSISSNGHHRDYPIFEDKIGCDVCGQLLEPSMLTLHKNMHIYTNSKDSHPHGNNNTKSGSSLTILNNSTISSSSKIPFNKPRSYKCVVCNRAFRVIGHLRKHHKSKSHLQGLVNSGLLSKALFSKIEQSKVPIQEVIDQKTGNIIPDVLSRYISNWSQANTDSELHH